MALDSRLYKNPMLIVMEDQERKLKRSCKGCMHLIAFPLKADMVKCDKGRPANKRCNLYKA